MLCAHIIYIKSKVKWTSENYLVSNNEAHYTYTLRSWNHYGDDNLLPLKGIRNTRIDLVRVVPI